MPILTQEESLRGMTFDSGRKVVFDDDGSFVLNKMSGVVNWMREDSGNDIMDMGVMSVEGQGFSRQHWR